MRTVITIDISDDKTEQARNMGADIVINSSKEDVEAMVLKYLPEGADYVVDAVGINQLLNQGMRLIKYNGKVCGYGISPKLGMDLDWSDAPYNWQLHFVQFPRKKEEAEAMNITQVYAVYFSATGNTRKVTTTLANALAVSFDVPLEVRDFTLPAAREESYEFAAGDLVVFGMPTYAGKLPNKLLEFVKSGFHGNGALAVPVVTFGNRSFDNSLAELCACLEGDGFHTIGAGAFACRHAFTDALADGRPDSDDMAELAKLGSAVVGRIVKMTDFPAPVTVDGDADAPYYRPLGLDGEPKVFLKAKPKTNTEKCTRCGVCASLCPMGSINPDDVTEVVGICIKCHSCVRNCPVGAKYFDDPAFLSHRAMLERDYTRRAEDKIFTA